MALICFALCIDSAQGTECPPPPPVVWSHVTGLQPTVISSLKGCVRALDGPAQMSSALILLPSYLLYIEAYYSQLCVQVGIYKKKEIRLKASVAPDKLFLKTICSSGGMENLPEVYI